MRPVNLIPAEERRDKRPVRTGPIAYLLVGALALALGAVTMVVLTNNKISDRKAEIAGLEQQEVAAKARADQLAPFSQFASVEDQRAATIENLADSRFDWERVMRELALVLPDDVWLTNLTGAVSGSTSSGVSSSGGSTGSTIDTSSITGPSLTLDGCAAGQESVARFLSALRDIDGVTRVGLGNSDLPDDTTSSGDSASSSTDCSVRDFIAKFSIVAAFDAVPPPGVPGAAPTAPAPTAPASTGTSTETTPASETTGATGGSS